MLIHRSIRRVLLASAVMVLAATAGATTAAAATPPVVQNVSGSGQGSVIEGLAPAGAPLLSRFQYHFSGDGDHPLRRLAEFPLPGQSGVELTMADKNGDDKFTYSAAHLAVDPAPLLQGTFRGNCAKDSCAVAVARPSGDFVFVLTGFRFSFDIAEHQLDKVAVTESNTVITTTFRDQNGDDPYTYDVSYAWVPRARLGVVDEADGVVHGSVRATSSAAAGQKVIRGFSLDNLASGDQSDNNIKDIGVVTSTGTVSVLYGDRNPADSADWAYLVNYATLV